MDNVVQNINIEDIIPSNFKPSNEEKRKIEELAILIRQFGLLDPILVRPKNNKYEIILGMDKYQAALIANQNIIPVIIKEVTDEIYSKYSNIDTNKTLNNQSNETFSEREKNSDIVNLSELSKIKLEYERDDVKMNNGQFNNEMVNNNLNLNQPNMNQEGPTFGGRFFPSLEDEPTNMNMMGGFNTPQAPSVTPNLPNDIGINNNLIDLTDLSVENGTPAMPNFTNQPLNMPTVELNNDLNQITNDNMQNFNANPVMSNDTIINLDSLQNNNPSVRPISEPTNEPVPMEILNADFGAPQASINQFDMGSNLNIIQNQDLPSTTNPVQPDFGLNQPVMPQQVISTTTPQPMPNFDIDATMPQNIETPQPTVEVNNVTLKDVSPVTNTIKNLVTSLETFGYKINVNEEELPNTCKLIIEIEK